MGFQFPETSKSFTTSITTIWLQIMKIFGMIDHPSLGCKFFFAELALDSLFLCGRSTGRRHTRSSSTVLFLPAEVGLQKYNTDIEINIYNLTRKSKGYLSYLTLEICPDTQVKKSVNRFKGKLELGIEII